MKKLVIFDLDGTLAESKSPIDSELSAGLCSLLGIVKVAVISGGNWPQFKEQVLSRLPSDAGLENLSSCLHVGQSSSNIKEIGKRSIRKISPARKKRRSTGL